MIVYCSVEGSNNIYGYYKNSVLLTENIRIIFTQNLNYKDIAMLPLYMWCYPMHLPIKLFSIY